MADKETHKKLFNEFCIENSLSSSGKVTSKTVNQDKAERIKQVLRVEKLDLHSPSFRFWVKKTKRFEILTYPDLNLHDVLCVPVKCEVSHNYSCYTSASYCPDNLVILELSFCPLELQ